MVVLCGGLCSGGMVVVVVELAVIVQNALITY